MIIKNSGKESNPFSLKALLNDIILVENNKIICDKEEISGEMNTSFIERVDNLEIEPYAPDNVINISSENMDASSIKTLQDIIKKYESHPSIIKINENVKKENIFSFTDMTSLDFENEIIKLDKKKASMDDGIPTKILIGIKDIVSNYLSNSYNDSTPWAKMYTKSRHLNSTMRILVTDLSIK